MIVPNALLTQTIDTILTLGLIHANAASKSIDPSVCTGMNFKTEPVSAQIPCQGTKLLWCSISVSNTSSPGFKTNFPYDAATKLILSVTPLVKIHSADSLALINVWSNSRVDSNCSVALEARVCAER